MKTTNPNMLRGGCFMLMVLCASSSFLKAQDVHFSQFYETSILRNPSLMGIYSEDYKVTGQYRNQWSSVGKGFRTGQLSAEFRFPVNQVNDFLSIGILGYSDKAGSIDMKTLAFYPAINYNKSLEDNYNSYLSVGFAGGYLSRSIDITKMTFDNQYQNGNYNPANASGEQLPESKLTHWDLGAGVSFNSSPSDHASYYLGASAYHFTRPRRSFYAGNDAIRLQTRWNANAGFSWFVSDEISLLLHGNYMIQGPYKELLAGGFLKWTRVTYDNPRAFGIYAGAFYRLGDAIVPVLKLDWKGQSFAFSYDINISGLRDATHMRGGLEVTVYNTGFLNTRPEDKRSCPRF